MVDYRNYLLNSDYGTDNPQAASIITNALQQKKQNALAESANTRANEANTRANTLLDQKTQEFELEMMKVPVQFAQMKLTHLSKMAGEISTLPQNARAQRYNQMVNEVAPSPVGTHGKLGPLGVISPTEFMPVDEFVKLSDEQQTAYLDTISMSSDQIAKVNVEDRKAQNKIDSIFAEADKRMQQIKASGQEERKTEDLKQRNRLDLEMTKQKGRSDTSAKENQDRIDRYRKEISNLAAVRERIRKGDSMYQISQQMQALDPNMKLDIPANASVEEAIKKVDEYESWLRKRLKKMGDTDSNDENDPLGLFSKSKK